MKAVHTAGSRAEQSRAEQSRAEQSRAEQSRAEQSRAEQSRAEQSRAEQSRAEQSRIGLPFFVLFLLIPERIKNHQQTKSNVGLSDGSFIF